LLLRLPIGERLTLVIVVGRNILEVVVAVRSWSAYVLEVVGCRSGEGRSRVSVV